MRPVRRNDRSVAFSSVPSSFLCCWMTIFPTDKEIFHLARHRALRRGDPAAVQVMYNKLVPRLKMAGFSEVDMRAQLLREYGVRVKVGDNGTLNLRSASITEQLAVHMSITATRHGMALQRQGVVI
ncbi:hypothetical protein PHLGIDRAFT_339736 [Phlebiopsis gigantea 11061_1 CR5-6]|uniref:Uncharacterized protein n=1 Tax=Phlebiopsis gigantea (strain 11061_1 CR5-6) TaxID=745531 RepID=A0A0C3S270_PHLG1|nr:hypothetical protein PHLGIDRAFT_339736 [Phlebiopsis gigantea 11061_1 CR5-6]